MHRPPTSTTADDRYLGTSPRFSTSLGSTTSTRKGFTSITHLSGFEVAAAPKPTASGALSAAALRRQRIRSQVSKERYLHANFRFVVADSQTTIYNDPDIALPWNAIELVVVPRPASDVICPICMEIPTVPRLTRCGHFFCAACIMRFVETGQPCPTGRWRRCPVCFERMHPKQLMSALFQPVCTIKEGDDLEMTLLLRPAGSIDAMPLEETAEPSITRLSPFRKITRLPRTVIQREILEMEVADLQAQLVSVDEIEDVTGEHAQSIRVALQMAQDRLDVFIKHQPLPTLADDSDCTTSSSSSSSSPNLAASSSKVSPSLSIFSQPVYLHQSTDGQPVFLHPLMIKMLKRAFHSYSQLPVRLKCPLVELEVGVMSEEGRKRWKHLAHLPLGCQFALAEVDLSGVIPRSIMAEFKPDLDLRERQRRARKRREQEAEEEVVEIEVQQPYSLPVETAIDEPELFELDPNSWTTVKPSLAGFARVTATGTTLTMNDEDFPSLPSADSTSTVGSSSSAKKKKERMTSKNKIVIAGNAPRLN